MTRPVASDAMDGRRPVVCTACPMLCDDILLRPDGSADRACEIGRAAFAAAGQAIAARRTGLPENNAAAWRGDRTIPLGTALDAAAQLLRGCRRVLVTGLAGATLEAVAGACDVAECLAAAVDPRHTT